MSDEDSRLAKFFRKIGDAVLNVKGLPEKVKRAKPSFSISRGEPKREIPSFLQEFFRRRNAEWPEYVILKAEILLVALFGTAVVLATFPSTTLELILIPLFVGLSGYTLYLCYTQLRVAFSRDFPAYRTFVLMTIALASVLVLILRFVPSIWGGTFPLAFLPVVLVIVFVGSAFAGFKLKYGRDYTYGKVERIKGDKASVRIRWDIKSNAKHGIYLLDSLEEVEPGDEVKVGVDRSMLGLRGSEPTAILEKVE